MITQNLIFLATSSLFILSLLHNLFQTGEANCTPSACGIIRNISHPLRLKGDPSNCGDRRFELTCENNVTSIYLNSHKYYVKAINYSNGYDNPTIRLADASINNDDLCSFPTLSIDAYNFTYENPYPINYVILSYSSYPYDPLPINFISCPNPLTNSSLFTDITNLCASNSSNRRYAYIKVGHMKLSELPYMCYVEVIVMTSWQEFKDFNNVSLSEIHHSLLYGFELMVCPGCGIRISTESVKFIKFFLGLLCAVASPPVFTIFGFAALTLLLYRTTGVYFLSIYLRKNPDVSSVSKIIYLPLRQNIPLFIGLVIDFIILAPRLIIFPLVLWLLIKKFRRRHLSIYNRIESFLRSDNKLSPIRYSYSDIRKMTRGFHDKLGEGGYGSVYKGKLRSGHDVAVKLLGKSRGNGQDFMNEIATIGRIHHVNVVNLVGYCAHGSKRALVYDFMPNGSLEKYIFNRDKITSLNWDRKFEIAVGVARGIEYLHRGCDVQILHFDIKPHNILLDDSFIPKISDFGLAKFCSTDKKAVTMTAARGTIGYVAPELISRSIGAVSYKADVYSFGMLLMEMAGLNRDLSGNNGGSSQYFPYWIYDSFEQGKNIEIMKLTDENDDNDVTRKLVRKMAIVALWCIQMSPNDRPSMNKVLEMLEADVECLHIPVHPSQSTYVAVNVDQTEITSSTDSISLQHHDYASTSVEIAQELQS
ncbi:LEAF RUST 10 DISEASE-RESISTANCE LOCUS RECEPTOR-LIKE PROTEIN KINASE-like 2.1 isoform X2 [Salvia miltiorrhiza]|uniref:LEAF RUST 10 DISEASE-RESISTANCE LOCUS RECEPTOR-LIKE PROTEIN KINASE-like 2.1 isoform X2 n=1 Tax=Salvia miltiorrhiza TaxID=226208 RepID=UPI0025ACFF64|nr:LEAF RUST 10 DISEASE-RESISTANCE LOCUS RECEPTOR-LIKE PROTEIN KINASE-like 2.1 isoform X2 [Salvia miltiorrhiza]